MSINRSAVERNEGEGGDAASLSALIPFSGAFSPEQVRSQMANPNLSGQPTTIWRRTTIRHANADGSYCLYACERIRQAMWVPDGEYFVADRSRGAQLAGTVMDYVLSQGRQAFRPESCGMHSTDRTSSGENENIRQPRNNRASRVDRAERVWPTRLHRFNPLVRSKPAAAGMESSRTVARRERRKRVRAVQNPLPPPTTTRSTESRGNGQPNGKVNVNPNNQGATTATKRMASITTPLAIPTITIYNSNNRPNGDGTPPPQATLNLSDDDEPDS